MPDLPDAIPAKFARLGLTYDDVLLLPGETDVVPAEVDTTHPAHPRDRPRRAAAVGGDGHRHRGADGDRDGPSGRHRRPAPQPVDRGPGRPGRPRQAHPDRADPEPGDHRPGRHPRAARRGVRRSTASRGCRSSTADQRLLGIITNRDLRFVPVAEWATTKVDEVMTPLPLITAPVGIAHDDATAILRQHKRERLPLVDEQGRLAGLITVKDFVKSEQFPQRVEGRARAAAGRRRHRLLRRRLAARHHAGRRRRGRARRRHRARTRPAAARHGAPAQVRPGDAARPGHRRQRRHPGRCPGVRRRRRRRGQGRRRAGLDLHHPGRHRRRRARRSPRSTTPRWPASRPASRSSPTAGCSTPATSPRPSWPAPTR